jgi:hypothetical protein
MRVSDQIHRQTLLYALRLTLSLFHFDSSSLRIFILGESEVLAMQNVELECDANVNGHAAVGGNRKPREIFSGPRVFHCPSKTNSTCTRFFGFLVSSLLC